MIDGTEDVTSELLGSRDVITAATLEDLAEEVVATLYPSPDDYEIVWSPERDASLGVDDQRRAVISDGPSVGDLGEVTVDVLDVFDDSIAAERLTIVAQPVDAGFELRTVEVTYFCWRAGGGGDICV